MNENLLPYFHSFNCMYEVSHEEALVGMCCCGLLAEVS